MKLINLEEGMSTVDQARLRLAHELQSARQEGFFVVKIIHGYGSTGVGGTLRTEMQNELRKGVRESTIRGWIAGEDWRISDASAWDLLKRFPEWKKDSDLGRRNQGISIVIF